VLSHWLTQAHGYARYLVLSRMVRSEAFRDDDNEDLIADLEDEEQQPSGGAPSPLKGRIHLAGGSCTCWAAAHSQLANLVHRRISCLSAKGGTGPASHAGKRKRAGKAIGRGRGGSRPDEGPSGSDADAAVPKSARLHQTRSSCSGTRSPWRFGLMHTSSSVLLWRRCV
jgi:hypothetical protein